MKLKTTQAKGLKFYCRPGTSDEKTVVEVVERDTYQQRGLHIEPADIWLDLGGNIGAFACLALSRGAAFVDVYEPDPGNAQLLRANLALNGFDPDRYRVNEAAVVADEKGKAFLHQSKTEQHWRNSLLKNWGGPVLEVETIHFSQVIKPGLCVKMDIEGCEMPIIEAWDIPAVRKLVFEWSFDVDDDIDRYRAAVQRMSEYFITVKAHSIKAEHKRWLKSWFPPCKNVHCFNL